MAISYKEERLLNAQYLEWHAKEIRAGRVAKPPPFPYDPSKKLIPEILESKRVRLGEPLQKLEGELLGFKAARATGQPVDPQRLLSVHREAERLRIQGTDIALATREQAEHASFMRGSRAGIGKGSAPTKRAGGILGKIIKNRRLLLGGAAATLALGYMFSGDDRVYNTIPGLHPGSEGLGANVLRDHSDFGSGYMADKVFRGLRQTVTEESYDEYTKYKSPARKRAEASLSAFAAGKENLLKFPAMGDIGFAAKTRAQLTEFKEEFASRWDPLRKIAKEVFKDSADDVAFKQLTQSKAFKEAIATGMKTPGKKLGEGIQGEVWGYATKMRVGDKMHDFEFAVKRGTKSEASGLSDIIRHEERLAETFRTEAKSMKALGKERAPSLYGRGRDFGLDEESVVMEQFQLGRSIQEAPLDADEVTDLMSFMKSAHKRGITHTDMHGKNVVRAINPATGKEEVAALDWGLANRFQKTGGIGGTEEAATYTKGAKILQERLQESVGRPVGFHEFSEVADILRVKGHGAGVAKTSRSSTHAVNSIYLYEKAAGEVRVLEKQLLAVKSDSSIKKVFVRQAEEGLEEAAATLADRDKLLSEVADNVANHLASGNRSIAKVPSPLKGSGLEFSFNNPPAGSSGLEFSFGEAVSAARGTKETGTAVMNKVAKRIQKAEDIGQAATLQASWAAKTMKPEQSASLATALQGKARREAIRRNDRFNKLTKKSVGIGLRSSARATKGHAEFASSRSTVI